jgi:hypothetical protein
LLTISFVRCLREFIRPPPNQKAFENFFVPALPRLSHDVIDVRLGLAQAIADLFVVGAYYGQETGPIPKEISQLTELLSDDEAADVRDTIKKVDLARMHKGKGVPHRVEPQTAPDRAQRPDDHPDSRKTSGVNAAHPDQSQSTEGQSGLAERRPSVEVTDKMVMMNLEQARSNSKGASSEDNDGGSVKSLPDDKRPENSPHSSHSSHISFETPSWIGPRSSSGDIGRQQAFPRRKPSDPFSASFSHAMTSTNELDK